MDRIKLHRYPTPESMLAEWWGCDPSEVEEVGTEDLSGDEVDVLSADAFVENIKAMKVFGFIRGKKTIHFWAHRRATLLQLVEFFAHELGHAQPIYSGFAELETHKEEARAVGYESVAVQAVLFARQVRRERP